MSALLEMAGIIGSGMIAIAGGILGWCQERRGRARGESGREEEGDPFQSAEDARAAAIAATVPSLPPSTEVTEESKEEEVSRSGRRITAAEIMRPASTFIYADQTVGYAAKVMAENDVDTLLVCDRDRKLKGVVTDHDLVVKGLLLDVSPYFAEVGEISGNHLNFAQADDSMVDVLEVMRTRRVRHMPVIDRDENLVGVIAEAELAKGHEIPNGLTDGQIANFMASIYARRIAE